MAIGLKQEATMKTPNEIRGIIEKGKVTFPEGLHLPDGTRVRVVIEETNCIEPQPYDRQELTEADIRRDVKWATGHRFQR